MFRRDAGQVCDHLGHRRNGPEFFVPPDVHCLSGDANRAGAVGEGFAGHLGEDVSHWVTKLVGGRAQLMLKRGGGDGFADLIEDMNRIGVAH